MCLALWGGGDVCSIVILAAFGTTWFAECGVPIYFLGPTRKIPAKLSAFLRLVQHLKIKTKNNLNTPNPPKITRYPSVIYSVLQSVINHEIEPTFKISKRMR